MPPSPEADSLPCLLGLLPPYNEATTGGTVPTDSLSRPALLSMAQSPTQPPLQIPYSTLGSLILQFADRLQVLLGKTPTGSQPLVSVVCPDPTEYLVTFLGIAHLTWATAPLNPAYKEDEFEFFISDCDACALIVGSASCEAAQLVARRRGIPTLQVALDVGAARVSIETLAAPNCSTTDDPVTGTTHRNCTATKSSSVECVIKPCLVLHTSGSTSRPKAVPLTATNLACSARNIACCYNLGPDDVAYLVMPLFHVHGLIGVTLSTLASKGTVALTPLNRFSASRFWLDALQARVTWYSAVPTIHKVLLDCKDKCIDSSSDALPRPPLRFVRSSSASMPPDVLRRLEQWLRVPVLEALGMTEAAHQIASNPPDNGTTSPDKFTLRRQPGTVGLPQGVEVCILECGPASSDLGGSCDKCLPCGTPGELCIRGPSVMSGYLNNPHANKTNFTQDGWFRTGDLAVIGETGYISLVGRIKELINRGGEKISPGEVDSTLLSHPDVAQAVAFGVPDVKYGEVVGCAVVLKPGAKQMDPKELQAHCSKTLADFKVPSVVHFTETLSTTATGKIQRRVIAEQFGGF